MIRADRELLARLSATNQHIGRETLNLLDSLEDGYLPADALDDLGSKLVELGQAMRRRAAELTTEIDGVVLSSA